MKSQRLLVTMPPNELDHLRKLAAFNNKSVSCFARETIQRVMEEIEDEILLAETERRLKDNPQWISKEELLDGLFD